MKTNSAKLLSMVFGLLVAGSQACQADTRNEKVQRDARAAAAGGAVVATALGGPELAPAGAILGGGVVGEVSRGLRSGEVQRAKKDLSRHKRNVKKALKKLF